MKRTMFAVLMSVGLTGALCAPVWAQEDGDAPDHGVARLSIINGDVNVRRGDTGETVAGELNAPLVASDHVLTGPGSRAEVQFDFGNMIRVGASSEIRLGELEDRSYLIQVAAGTTTFRVLRDSSALVEISTPNVSVRPSEKGTYRVTVRPDGSTEVTVRDGRADIFSQRGSEILRNGQTLEARGTASDPEYKISSAIAKDEWDRWNQNRDTDLERSTGYQYVSRDIYGADDLEGNGRWVYDPPYGNVWVPNVDVGWAPYRVGRWTYLDYYGWTWLSADPWGWAPYHYGSWYSSPFGWAWYPGVIGPRYYWRPALVGFFGWGGGGIGVGFGGGWGFGNVGWVPLAPYEVFRPWYGRGFRGGTNINIVNNTNITNIYRNARNVNGRLGVTSVPSNNFGHGRVDTNTFVPASNNDLNRAGQVRGGLPFAANSQSRRFSDRNPSPTTVATGASTNQNFVTRPDRTRSNGQLATANTNGRSAGNIVTPGQSTSGNTARSGGGWRRFDPQTDNAPRNTASPSVPRTRASDARPSQPSEGFRGSPRPTLNPSPGGSPAPAVRSANPSGGGGAPHANSGGGSTRSNGGGSSRGNSGGSSHSGGSHGSSK